MRVWILWLVLIVAGGPVWLDRCLVNCHDAGGAPVCHEHAAGSAAPTWQSAGSCDHDHDGSWTAISDVTSGSHSRVAAVALPLPAAPSGPPADASARVSSPDPPSVLTFAAFLRPLRI